MATRTLKNKKPSKARRKTKPIKEPGDSLIWRGSVPADKVRGGKSTPRTHKIEYRVTFVYADPRKGTDRSPNHGYSFTSPDKHTEVIESLFDELQNATPFEVYPDFDEEESSITFRIPRGEGMLVHSLRVNEGRPLILRAEEEYEVLSGLWVRLGG